MWEYLKESGVLDYGSDEDIAKARLEFTRKRDREYKAKRRLKMREHVVRLDMDEGKRVALEAQKYGMFITNFLKWSCLAYMNKIYLVPDTKSVRKIEACVVRTLSAIERISAREYKNTWFGRGNDFNELKELVSELRNEIKKELQKPDLLIHAIVNNPAQWEEILKVINDNKDTWNKKQ